MALEGGVGHVADVVVGFDILLDSLTAAWVLVRESASVSWDESMT